MYVSMQRGLKDSCIPEHQSYIEGLNAKRIERVATSKLGKLRTNLVSMQRGLKVIARKVKFAYVSESQCKED